MAEEAIQVFVSSHCGSCAEVKRILESGQFSQSDGQTVDLIDVDTEEGFDRMQKHGGVVAVPSAFYEGKKCRILKADEMDGLHIDCQPPVPESRSSSSDDPPPTP